MSTDQLVPFQADLKLNVSEGDVLRNLYASKDRKLPELAWREDAPALDATLIICGSGPSLKRNLKFLPGGGDDAVHVMALNGAYRYLRQQGMLVDYFACLDARPENAAFVENPGLATTHVLASQVHPDVYKALDGYTTGTFHLATPSVDHVFGDTVLKIGAARTIGLTAVLLGCILGYRKFILLGYDSSFATDGTHVVPQPWNKDQETVPVWIEDRRYLTTHAMAQQVAEFLPTLERLRTKWPDLDVQVIGEGLFYDFVVTNNNPPSRERELGKYAQAYEDHSYGMSPQRKEALDRALKDLAERPTTGSYLDLSCGRGESLVLAKKHGIPNVRGTETVDALCGPEVAQATLPNTGLPAKCADAVSLVEVIEHLLPEDVEPALNELTRLARNHILISAATSNHLVGGVNLHPSARPLEEWDSLFQKVWGEKVKRIHDMGFSPMWRVDL